MSHSEQQIRDCLPIPPMSFKYRIYQESKTTWRITLLHPNNKYTYTTKHVETIWGFIYKDMVYPPGRVKGTKGKSPICPLTDIPDDLSHTTIRPREGVTSLLHLGQGQRGLRGSETPCSRTQRRFSLVVISPPLDKLNFSVQSVSVQLKDINT